jgi:hypothetical protein
VLLFGVKVRLVPAIGVKVAEVVVISVVPTTLALIGLILVVRVPPPSVMLSAPDVAL